MGQDIVKIICSRFLVFSEKYFVSNMLKHKIFNHTNIYILGLILLSVSLPLSLFMMSASAFLLFTNWLLEGNFQQKWRSFKSKPGLGVFMSIILVHVAWLLNSADLDYGLNDIKIKLPLLVLPLVLGTSKQIDRKQLKMIIDFFILSVLVGSLISTAVLLGFTGKEIDDIREISLFIHHVRFGVLIVLAVFLLIYDSIYYPKNNRIGKTILKWVVLLWLIVFLFILKSITGLMILFVVAFIFGFSILFYNKKIKYKYAFISIWFLAFTFLLITMVRYYSMYSYIEEIDLNNLERITLSNNTYTHNLENAQLENGHYVWIYLCEDELRNEWSKRSELNYDGLDNKNQELRYTIIRYLSSRGVRKDSVGLASIGPEEIKWIENGIANHIYKSNSSMYPLFYNVLWQFDSYKRGDNPSGHSVIQRMEHLKAGFNVFKDNFWFGVGTGDVKSAFNKYYDDVNSPLSEDVRHRAHNQFLTFLIAFGILGFILTLFTLVFPIWNEKGNLNAYFIIFITIAFFSFLAEDVLETSAGSMFFAYFYSLFLFAFPGNSKQGLI